MSESHLIEIFDDELIAAIVEFRGSKPLPASHIAKGLIYDYDDRTPCGLWTMSKGKDWGCPKNGKLRRLGSI